MCTKLLVCCCGQHQSVSLLFLTLARTFLQCLKIHNGKLVSNDQQTCFIRKYTNIVFTLYLRDTSNSYTDKDNHYWNSTNNNNGKKKLKVIPYLTNKINLMCFWWKTVHLTTEFFLYNTCTFFPKIYSKTQPILILQNDLSLPRK